MTMTMREIGCCQLGDYITLVGVCRVPLMGRSSKQTQPSDRPPSAGGFLRYRNYFITYNQVSRVSRVPLINNLKSEE